MVLEDIGSFIYETFEAVLNQWPKVLLRFLGRFMFTASYVSVIKMAALQSQQHQYPADWVYTLIEGDGREFDYGMDFTECAIKKFFHVLCADELTPYVCSLDYAMSNAFGQGMKRTMTLAEGGKKCDFRYKWEGG